MNAAGYVFLKNNQLEEARTVFALIVYLFPEEANTYDSLAEAFVTQGNEEGAIWAYEKVVSLQPENEKVKETLLQLKASAKAGTSGK